MPMTAWLRQGTPGAGAPGALPRVRPPGPGHPDHERPAARPACTGNIPGASTPLWPTVWRGRARRRGRPGWHDRLNSLLRPQPLFWRPAFACARGGRRRRGALPSSTRSTPPTVPRRQSRKALWSRTASSSTAATSPRSRCPTWPLRTSRTNWMTARGLPPRPARKKRFNHGSHDHLLQRRGAVLLCACALSSAFRHSRPGRLHVSCVRQNSVRPQAFPAAGRRTDTPAALLPQICAPAIAAPDAASRKIAGDFGDQVTICRAAARSSRRSSASCATALMPSAWNICARRDWPGSRSWTTAACFSITSRPPTPWRSARRASGR